jgi:hypothetical protein
MRPGHRDRITEPHKLGQHFGPLHNGHQTLASSGNLRIGFIDRAGNDNGICVLDVCLSVADEYGGALILEAPCLFVGFNVGALDFVAQA